MQPAAVSQKAPATVQRVSLHTIFLRFLTIGSVSFGGGIIAYLQQMIVDKTHWLTEDEFLGCLEVSQTLPGTNSTNMAVLVGDYLRGKLGAMVALTGLLLPGSVLVYILAVGSESGRHNPITHAALAGVTAGAVGILAAITLRTGHKQFIRLPDVLLLVATFVGMSFLRIPLLVLVIVFGAIGVCFYRPRQAASS